MGDIAGRLILLAIGAGLLALGLMTFGNLQEAAPKPPPIRSSLWEIRNWQDAQTKYFMSRWMELLGSFGAMVMGIIFIVGSLVGSVGTAISMYLPSPSDVARAISSSEVTHMDEFEAERRGGQKCPYCGSYDTYYVETVGVDTAQFKCNRCGSYFLKD